MVEDTRLPEVDCDLERRIREFPADFWSSKDRDPREDIHSYLQYPAMMVPAIQRGLIAAIKEMQPQLRRVMDPFLGAGTTMTASMCSGLDFSGQDINPLAVLVCQAKKGPFDDTTLAEAHKVIAALAKHDTLEQLEADFSSIDKWFGRSVQSSLSKIRRAIRAENRLWARRFFWVALAETVRLVSNSRTSTYKLHVRAETDLQARNPEALDVFNEVVRQNLLALRAYRETLQRTGNLSENDYCGKISVHLCDSSKEIRPPVGAEQYDLVVTSPPYGDNTSTVPYGQFSYLPLQWIDLKDIDSTVKEDCLRTTQEIDRRSLGGAIPSDLKTAVDQLSSRSNNFAQIAKALKAEPRDRLGRVTGFALDLERCVAPIVNSLRVNAYLIWFVGNRHVGGTEIRMDGLLRDFLDAHSATQVAETTRSILFRRMATRNKISSMMRQENVLIFRNKGA